MRAFIYLISTLLANIVFGVATALLVTAGIEKTGGDPGAPGIMLFVLLCLNGILSLFVIIVMEVIKRKANKQFPARLSALIFLLTFSPFHVLGLCFTDEQLAFLGSLQQPLAVLVVILTFFSYIPFLHMIAQGLLNVERFVLQKEMAGIKYPKYIFQAFLGVLGLLVGFYILQFF